METKVRKDKRKKNSGKRKENKARKERRRRGTGKE